MSNYEATMETNFGTMKIAFYPDVAPKTVENFVTLAKKGFYNGLKFHRIISGFMMQGGCPQGTGTGGPGYQIKAEFSAKPHVAGTLSMARTADPDSAGSQFFICFDRAAFLDRQYTVFGQVTEGLDVVKKVEAEAAVSGEGKPKKEVKMTTVTIREVPEASKGK